MSGPALYRYFASREDLLAALVADSYDDLAGTLEAAAQAARDHPLPERFRAVYAAYRAWAISHPELYRLVFSCASGSGQLAPTSTVPAARRNMTVILDGLAALAPPGAAIELTGSLAGQLEQWAPGSIERAKALRTVVQREDRTVRGHVTLTQCPRRPP